LIKRSWVRTPAPFTGWMLIILDNTLKTKIKVNGAYKNIFNLPLVETLHLKPILFHK
jgi:hypothetical protein